MLIGFLGSPCSGKTTIAANMFSELKKVGTNCELIVEQARHYIATKRYNEKLMSSSNVVLQDSDQLNIFVKQSEIEKIMKYSCGSETIVISDSSPLNSILYLSEDKFNDGKLQSVLRNVLSTYDILFYCHSINLCSLPTDPNRIHDLDAIKGVQSRSDYLLNKFKTWNLTKIHELVGTLSLEQRCLEANASVLNEHCNFLSRVK